MKTQLLKTFQTCKAHPLFMAGVVASLLVLAKVFYLFITPLDLAPDEAHYWEWSRQLDLSYYSKPPLVAWLIWLSTQVFDHTLIGVRFFALLAQGGLMLMAFDLARKAANSVRAGWLALTLVAVTPMVATGGLLMTPDVPSLFFFTLGVWMLSRIDFDKPEGQMRLFVLLGVVVGLAGLAKYTAAVFYPLLGVFLLVSAARRKWFARPEIYVAGFVSLLMTAPVFIWNAMNGWISFKHVAGQAGGSDAFEPLKTLGNFLGGELGVVGPVVFILMLIYWVMQGRVIFKEKRSLVAVLWWFSAPIFVFFVLKSLGSKVQPNWPLLPLFVGLIGLAVFVVDRWKTKAWRVAMYVGLSFSALITFVGHDTFMLRAVGVDFPAKNDPLKPVQGWRGLGALVAAHLDSLDDDTVILTTRYQTASELAFYARTQDRMPEVLYVNPGFRRQNQYDLWEWPDLTNKLVLYVNEGGNLPDVVKNGFESCGLLNKIASHRDGIIQKKASVYLCYGYKGINRPRPEVF